MYVSELRCNMQLIAIVYTSSIDYMSIYTICSIVAKISPIQYPIV